MNTYNLNTAEARLSEQKTAAFLTSGASMRPLIRSRKDIVVISRIDAPVKRGDVLLYKKAGVQNLILHRVIEVQDGLYITRGDNTYHKEYISKDDAVGVMTALYRGGKFIDPKKSMAYNMYVFFNRIFYPIRYIYNVYVRPILSKFKRAIIAKK